MAFYIKSEQGVGVDPQRTGEGEAKGQEIKVKTLNGGLESAGIKEAIKSQ